jgi:predicted MFS family arabinose efflux permease
MLKGLGTFVGTVIGGLLPGLFALVLSQTLDAPRPYGVALWVGAVLSVAALVPLLRVGELEQQAAQEQTEAHGPFPVLAVALMVLHVYLSHGGWAIRQVFSSAYMDTVLLLPAAAIGLITGMGQFVAVLTPLLNPRLSRRWGDGWTLMVTALGIGLSLLPMALISHWSAVAVASIGVLSLSALWMPALHVFQMEQVEPRWRSLAYGAVATAMGLSFGSASLVGGYIVAAMGYRAVFGMGVGISVAGAALMWAILRWRKTGKESILLQRMSSTSKETHRFL